MASKLFQKPSTPIRLKDTNGLSGINREKAAEKVGALVFKGLTFKAACEKCGFESETCEWMFKTETYNSAIETRKIEELRRSNSKFKYTHDEYCTELYSMSRSFDGEANRLRAMELLGKTLKFFESEGISITNNSTNNFGTLDFLKDLEAKANERRAKALTVTAKTISIGPVEDKDIMS